MTIRVESRGEEHGTDFTQGSGLVPCTMLFATVFFLLRGNRIWALFPGTFHFLTEPGIFCCVTIGLASCGWADPTILGHVRFVFNFYRSVRQYGWYFYPVRVRGRFWLVKAWSTNPTPSWISFFTV